MPQDIYIRLSDGTELGPFPPGMPPDQLRQAALAQMEERRQVDPEQFRQEVYERQGSPKLGPTPGFFEMGGPAHNAMMKLGELVTSAFPGGTLMTNDPKTGLPAAMSPGNTASTDAGAAALRALGLGLSFAGGSGPAATAARTIGGGAPFIAAEALEGGDVGTEALLQALLSGGGEMLSRLPRSLGARVGATIGGASSKLSPSEYERGITGLVRETDRSNLGMHNQPRTLELQKEAFSDLQNRLDQLSGGTPRPGGHQPLLPSGTVPPGVRLNLSDAALTGIEEYLGGVGNRSLTPITGFSEAINEASPMLAETMLRQQNPAGFPNLDKLESLRDQLSDILRAELRKGGSKQAPAQIRQNMDNVVQALGFNPFDLAPNEAYPIISELGLDVQKLYDAAKRGDALKTEGSARLRGEMHRAMSTALKASDTGQYGAPVQRRIPALMERYADLKAIERLNNVMRGDINTLPIRGAIGGGLGLGAAELLGGDKASATAMGSALGMFLSPRRAYWLLGKMPQTVGKIGPRAVRGLEFGASLTEEE